ncbi:MAG TPA: HAD family hydrolase [Lamprocystis sp. (in: g-proteobacteria)]|nr:HAD family hydrolase [Lamprocystis sp. (in: g-proteobacteria)]
MPHPRFRLITLDLDDTVWPCEPVIRAAEIAMLDWLAGCAPKLTQTHDRVSLREHRFTLMTKRPEIAHDLGLVRRRSLAIILTELGYPPDRAEHWAEQALAVFMAQRNRIEPFADAEPVLRRLAADYRLVSITNGNADPELTPLAGVFDHHVTAARAGAAKPDPAVFGLALELAGCTAAQCLHLGDEPYLDVEAARHLGIEAVWVNRSGRSWPADLAPPTLTVTDLHQVADWLDGRAVVATTRDAPGGPDGV